MRTETFLQSVPVSFAFLISDYGFSLIQQSDYHFGIRVTGLQSDNRLRSPGGGDFWVSIVPLRSEQITPTGDWPLQINLDELVYCLRSELPPFDYKGVRNKTDRAAKLLSYYGTPMLRGNFAIWPVIKRAREKKSREVSEYPPRY